MTSQSDCGMYRVRVEPVGETWKVVVHKVEQSLPQAPEAQAGPPPTNTLVEPEATGWPTNELTGNDVNPDTSLTEPECFPMEFGDVEHYEKLSDRLNNSENNDWAKVVEMKSPDQKSNNLVDEHSASAGDSTFAFTQNRLGKQQNLPNPEVTPAHPEETETVNGKFKLLKKMLKSGSNHFQIRNEEGKGNQDIAKQKHLEIQPTMDCESDFVSRDPELTESVSSAKKTRKTRAKKVKKPKSFEPLNLIFTCQCGAKYKLGTREEVYDKIKIFVKCSSCNAVNACDVVRLDSAKTKSSGVQLDKLPKATFLCGYEACRLSTATYTSVCLYISWHFRNIHIDDPQKCEMCGHVSRNKRTHHRHLKDVHGELNLSCDKCGKLYRCKGKLTNHIREVHINERLRCEICGLDFINEYRRSKHMKKHIDKAERKTYACDLCERAFRSEEGLRVHRKHHFQSFECSICHKKMTTKAGLAYHEESHRLEKMGLTRGKNAIRCGRCPKTFKTIRGRERHYIVDHEDDQ